MEVGGEREGGEGKREGCKTMEPRNRLHRTALHPCSLRTDKTLGTGLC